MADQILTAEPYDARQCPDCKRWIFTQRAPFAENDPTKTERDYCHWARKHATAEEVASDVVGFPFFTYNDKPVEATLEDLSLPSLVTLLSTPLGTAEAAEKWVNDLYAIGYGCHPDASGETLIDYKTDLRVFTDEQAGLYDARMEEAFVLLDQTEHDIYEVSLAAQQAHISSREPRITRYAVTMVQGGISRTVPVQVTEGYSSEADIPEIVAVRFKGARIEAIIRLD